MSHKAKEEATSGAPMDSRLIHESFTETNALKIKNAITKEP